MFVQSEVSRTASAEQCYSLLEFFFHTLAALHGHADLALLLGGSRDLECPEWGNPLSSGAPRYNQAVGRRTIPSTGASRPGMRRMGRPQRAARTGLIQNRTLYWITSY